MCLLVYKDGLIRTDKWLFIKIYQSVVVRDEALQRGAQRGQRGGGGQARVQRVRRAAQRAAHAGRTRAADHVAALHVTLATITNDSI